MSELHPLLQYGIYTAAGTMCGILYWFTVENLRDNKFRFVLAFLFSLVFSPPGAWFVSMIIRIGYLSKKRDQPSV
jgi:hypothetical protein